MAIGTLLSVAETLLSRLQGSELKELPSIFDGLSKAFKGSELKDFKGTVKTVIHVLRVADAVEELEELSCEAGDWIEDVKDAVFEADDLVDELITIQERSRDFEKMYFFFHIKQQIHKIKLIMKKLDTLAAKHSEFGFDALVKIGYHEPTWKIINTPETTNSPSLSLSYVKEVEVDIIGRQQDLENIVGRLLVHASDINDQNHVSVLSIVGMGGLGKTALARLVFNHHRIKDAFPLRVWTRVSDQVQKEFDFILILHEILASITQKHPDVDSTMDEVQSQLQAKLASHKYLLVLDDVWTENRDKWCQLMYFLSRGATGSCILVTTRSLKTARITSGYCHILTGLSNEHSWRLFETTAFASDKSNPTDELVMIGEKIVDRCGGLPLAIRVAGSFLYGQDISKWRSVLKGTSPSEDNDIMSILKLSFHDLESPLKNCILYCALFPRDYVIEKEILISLWMAQGYIVPLREHQSLEDAAQEYFTILCRRCFLEDVARDAYGEIFSCQLHYFIHDLASYVAGTEISLIKDQANLINKESRHLTLTGTADMRHVIRSTGIRSLLLVDDWHQNIKMSQSTLDAVMKNWKCLRTLDLSNSGIETLPNSLGDLLHLRYLNLSQNRDLKVLPMNITNLINLQTLILYGCSNLRELPEDLSKLQNLRVLDIENCFCLTCMPCGLGKLTGLHTLTDFVLSETSSNLKQWFDQLEDLGALQNLRGYLQIRIQSLDNVLYARREGAYLSNKEYLNEIEFSFTGSGFDGRCQDELMGILQPHDNIKGLVIRRYIGERIPRWITFLPNLVKLSLKECEQLQYLPYLGSLVHLEVLHLDDLEKLEYIFAPTGSQSAEVGSTFPALQQLHLINLPSLRAVNVQSPSKASPFPSLKELLLIDLPRLEVLWSGEEDGLMQSLLHRKLESKIIWRCPGLESVPPGSRVEELNSWSAGMSSTKESIDPATIITHESKVVEEHEMDSSLPDISHSLYVHPPQKPALPPAKVVDAAAAHTLSLSIDLDASFDANIVDDAFLCCSLFPPEYEFEKITLLQLWLADGIFDEEEAAGKFFHTFRSKGDFIFTRTNFLTGEDMYTFKGENRLVSKVSHAARIEDTFISNNHSLEVSHLSISCCSLNNSSDLSQFERFKQLRTLIFLQGHLSSFSQVPRDFFLSLGLLQTLDLSHTHLEELPSSIENLKFLRYLDLTKTPINHLPEALDCLENLQTLKLRGCSNMSALPKGMRKLIKLRHLDFDVLCQLRSMPEGMGALTNIRTLSAFIVGADVEEECTIRQLKNMNKLSGSFCISELQNVLLKDQAMEAYLHYKSQLRILELRWSVSIGQDVSSHTEVLSSLRPHARLEELRISCYGGSNLPSWICDITFCWLVNITLFMFENCTGLPSFGQLPALKSLDIISFNKLQFINHDFYGGSNIQGFIAFPNLERLTIQDMPSLEEWRDTKNPYLPKLLSLTVNECPRLSSLCTLSSSLLHPLKKLEITYCEMLESCFDEERPPPLETFIIEECPLINERILNDDQNLLKLLAQISDVWIDHQKILGLTSSKDEDGSDGGGGEEEQQQ